jgi:hypothetical protein
VRNRKEAVALDNQARERRPHDRPGSAAQTKQREQLGLGEPGTGHGKQREQTLDQFALGCERLLQTLEHELKKLVRAARANIMLDAFAQLFKDPELT